MGSAVVAYSIQEAAEESGLTAHTIRWYERIGLLDRVPRGSDGRRRFGAGDLEWLELLVKLRRTGMPVADMVRYAELVRAGAGTEERLALLSEHRERVVAAMAAQRDCLEFLDYKIDLYRGRLASGEEE
jgi:DNA-binding transcriptional MerR regulator